MKVCWHTQPAGHTEVNIEKGGIGTLHQDLLGGAVECLVHEVNTVSDHGSDPLSKALQGPSGTVSLGPGQRRPEVPENVGQPTAMPRNGVLPGLQAGPPASLEGTSAAPALRPYLEPFELAFNVYFQGGEHRLVLLGQALLTSHSPFRQPGPSSQDHRRLRYLEENSSKSDRRSQTRRPVRAALDE
ncbi:hypothetical protein P7K49_018732 [Saguinus oedipus]|uniref:Uncharacterized protein n=1 Tax=Saguinus oedipus TaxID=9490 RepID=A0ABQ9V681_SAGOE|nr:hypothetical protein P7K49_018732 [Saguinus oedipus]